MRAWSKPGLDSSDQGERLANFIHPYLEPSQDIALPINGYFERSGVVSGIGMVAPNVAVHTRRPAGHAHDAQISRFVGMQNASSFQPIARRSGGLDHLHQVGEFPLEDL